MVFLLPGGARPTKGTTSMLNSLTADLAAVLAVSAAALAFLGLALAGPVRRG